MKRTFAIALLLSALSVCAEAQPRPGAPASPTPAPGSVGFADVRGYGAKLDGTTDDTKAICGDAYGAVVARSGGLYIANTGHLAVISTGGCSFTRRTRVICEPGAGFLVRGPSGAAFVFGNDASLDWQPGGMEGCVVQSTAGGMTSVGIQIGSGTSHGQNMVFERNTISGFGHNVSFAGDGGAFLVTLRNNAIFKAICNGVFLNWTKGIVAEHIYLDDNRIFDNGNTGGTCTGINVAPNVTAALWLNGGAVDNNGNRGIGQIFVPASAEFTLWMSNVHGENLGKVAGPTPFLNCQAAGPRGCNVSMVSSDLLSNATAPSTYPLIVMRAGKLLLTGGTALTLGNVGTALTPIVQLGDGTHDEAISFSSFGTRFECAGGNLRNCQYAGVAANATKVSYSVAGSLATGSGAATAAQFGRNRGVEDLTSSRR